MDNSTSPNALNESRSLDDLICIYFCRKLLQKGFLSPDDLYSEENTNHVSQVETALSDTSEGPLELNGAVTPGVDPNFIQRLFNQHSNALSIRLENSIMAPKTWNCGVYSPIEVYIDSPSVIGNSGQASTMLSSVSASGDLSPESELFEMDVLERINRLRRQGKWSLTRLPLCLDAPRPKTHMDYLLEESVIMHTDFVMERETKRVAAKILVYEAQRYVQQKQKKNVVNLGWMPSRVLKRVRRKPQTQGDFADQLVSTLPLSYVGDLKSRVVSTTNDMFKEFKKNDQRDRWDLIEAVCNKIVSNKPDNLVESRNFNVKLRLFAGLLRSYQMVALKWLVKAYDNMFGCILSDEQKLGKKVEVISFMAYLEEYRKITGPHLIVTNDIASWISLLEQFLPHAKLLEFDNQKDNMLHDFDVCLMDHGTYFSENFVDSFGSFFFQVQVIDKADQLKLLSNKPPSYLFNENPMHGEYRFRILLGDLNFLDNTFAHTKFLPTLVMLLQMLMPTSLQRNLDWQPSDDELEKLMPKHLISLLNSFQLSRTKLQVGGQIPSSSLKTRTCRMTSKQQRLYRRLIRKPRVKDDLSPDKLVQEVNVLRKVCTHPFLIRNQVQMELPIDCSVYYSLPRQSFLDFEAIEFCEQLRLHKSFDAQIRQLHSGNLLICGQSTSPPVVCSPLNSVLFNICSLPSLANSPINFTGNYTCSLARAWKQIRLKQLAKKLFSHRSSQEDNFIVNSCFRSLDRSRLSLNSGKFQELLKFVARVWRQHHRCIIFTHYLSTQYLLCDMLSYHNLTYLVLPDDVDRKEFLNTVNRNPRITCVLASTRSSLDSLNLNNVGAVFVLETDWKFEYNNNIKRYFTEFAQDGGAKFYNLVAEDSLELKTNTFDIDLKSDLYDIGQSILYANNEEKTYQKELDAKNDESNFTDTSICYDMDDNESLTDSMSSSGYEGSLDEDTISQNIPLTYDRDYFENDAYLTSLFGFHWRQNTNNKGKHVFTEEALVYDSFANPWYTGEVIEPDEIEYTKMSPSEQQIDEDTLFDFADDQENQYLDSRGLSPKSTDDLLDLSAPSISAENSRITSEFTLDPAIQMQAQRPVVEQDQEARLAMKKSTQRMQSRTDELRRKLLENQSIVLPDPEPLFRPDGKNGYTPSGRNSEWLEVETPSWSIVEDQALLSLVVSQLRAIPIPTYISRNFCINWDLIAFNVNKVSFHDRSPNHSCTRFRELASKSKPVVENPVGIVERFDKIDLSVLNDERVASSTQQSTRCLNKSVSILARKIEDLKRMRNTWQSRTNWLVRCDEEEQFNVLSRLDDTQPRAEVSRTLNSIRVQRLMRNEEKTPFEILPPDKKGLPLEMAMVLHQYSRALRLSRVMLTAKSFINASLKRPADFGRIMSYGQPSSYLDSRMFVVEQDSWKLQVVTSAAFNCHSNQVPKMQHALEGRLLWVDHSRLTQLKNQQENYIRQMLHPNLMQFTVDIRSNMIYSRKITFDSFRFASNFLLPKMPKRPNKLVTPVVVVKVDVDKKLLEDVQLTVKTLSTQRVMKNGLTMLPINLAGYTQKDLFFYKPIMPKLLKPCSRIEAVVDILPLFQQSLDMNSSLANDVCECAALAEEFLLEWQDCMMLRFSNNLQFDPNCRYFTKANHKSLILKAEAYPTVKRSASSGYYVVTCVPDDRIELRRIGFNRSTQEFDVDDPHTIAILKAAFKASCNTLSRTKTFVPDRNFSRNSLKTVLTTFLQQTDMMDEDTLSDQVVFNPTLVQLQRQARKQYVRENRHRHNTSLFLQHNFIQNAPLELAYSVRPNIPLKKLYKKSKKFGNAQLQALTLIQNGFLMTRIVGATADSASQLRFLIGQSEGPQNEGLKELFAGLEESVPKTDSFKGTLCLREPSANSQANATEDALIDAKTLEQFCQLMQNNEGFINVDNLMLINQLYKLTQTTLKYSTTATESLAEKTKLPRPNVEQLSRITCFINSRFGPPKLPAVLNSLNPVKNSLTSLIDDHYSVLSIGTQQAADAMKKLTSDKEPSIPMVLKLQLRNLTPQLSQILPTNPAQFNVSYVEKGRLLKLRYQVASEHIQLSSNCLDESRLTFNVKCQKSANVPTEIPGARKAVVCRALEKPLIKRKLIHFLAKMPIIMRKRWLAGVKHRYLRLKTFKHKQQVLHSVNRMHKIIDLILKENNEKLDKSKHVTALECKKSAVRRLLLNSTTKFPTSLSTICADKRSTTSTLKTSPLLIELLVQTTAKYRSALCDRLHPSFSTVESLGSKVMKNKSRGLRIDYGGPDKRVLVFNSLLENFFCKLKKPATTTAKPIDSTADIYNQLLCRSNIGPSKLIKYRAPAEPNENADQKSFELSEQVRSEATNPPSTASSVKLYKTSEQTHNAPMASQHLAFDSTAQQTETNRERLLPAIPSAMQVPNLKSVCQQKPDSQITKSPQLAESVYYTKQSLNAYLTTSTNLQVHRSTPSQTLVSDSDQYLTGTVSTADSVRRDTRVQIKAPQSRPVVRHVVVGSRPKVSEQMDEPSGVERNVQVRREDLVSHETRYYQPLTSQRELTVREKLQQDMARGFAQSSSQKKFYPVRMHTTMKRKISETQMFGDGTLSNDSNPPKRSRPAQYVYQVKSSPTASTSASFSPTVQSVRLTQSSSSMSGGANNAGNEQPVTNQTVPIIYHHGEPIKTYIRRDNHQFAIHDSATYSQIPSTGWAQPAKLPVQHKVYEKRTLPTTSSSAVPTSSQTTLSKCRNELSDGSKPAP